MTSNFNLQKYLIENKVTTNSKLLKEISIEPDWNVGRRNLIIEIKLGGRGSIDSVKEYLIGTDFDTYCYQRGEQILEEFKEGFGGLFGGLLQDIVEEYTIGKPYFNADMTACDIPSSDGEGYIYIQSHTLEEDVRDKLLDEKTPADEIDKIAYSLGIQYN